MVARPFVVKADSFDIEFLAVMVVANVFPASASAPPLKAGNIFAGMQSCIGTSQALRWHLTLGALCVDLPSIHVC